MSLVEGEIIRDGMDIIRYLDRKFSEAAARGFSVTGIIIGTIARKYLTEACQKVMGQPTKNDITINKYRNILMIEDGNTEERIEVITARNPVLPVEGNVFLRGLRPPRRGAL